MIFLKKNNRLIAVIALFLITVSCKHKSPILAKPDPLSSQYPAAVAKIIVDKCATAGCHNEASYTYAGGLRLDDWQHMFDGGGTGAVVVAYSPENSPLLYFLNPGAGVYDHISVKPTMPYNDAPLSKEEYNTIKDWITNGAPDKNGNIPFASNAATRQKAYLTQQGCDLVAVIDAEKNVVMRYIKVGDNPDIGEAAHNIHIDKQGRYAYVCFPDGYTIQKIDCTTDKVVGAVRVDAGYNVVKVSDDGSKLIASQTTASQMTGGDVSLYNTTTMTLINVLAEVNTPHGIAYTRNFDTFYVTNENGNTISKIDLEKGITYIPITRPGERNPGPHDIMMLPDDKMYFVTCQKTNDVRVMDKLTNTLVKVIPVGRTPKEFAISKTSPYLFITCIDEISQISALYKGAIYVIDYTTLNVVKRIDGEFYKPHGITVDDYNGVFYVASLNDELQGPDPHHISNCNGRNGYYQVYDLNSLERVSKKTYEVPPSPYAIQMRFRK